MSKGIRKFSAIKSFGSFRDFAWDNSVKDNGGTVCLCEDINVIYGRNYSGKTTLSRIVRAMQQKQMPAHYEGAKFTVEFTDRHIVDQTLAQDTPLPIRVFNQDFVCDNLRFLLDTRSSDGTISSFAVIGEANNRLEEEIKHLEDELGSNATGHETGLRLKFVMAQKDEGAAKKRYDEVVAELDGAKKRFATDKATGIKYKSNLYGDQNYSAKKLDDDLRIVRNSEYVCVNPKECEQLKSVVAELPKTEVKAFLAPSYRLGELLVRVCELATREVVQGKKIQDLLIDVARENWARAGLKFHDGSEGCTCLFCGNKIGKARWEDLNAHFADASEKLNSDIELAITDVCKEMEAHGNEFNPNKSYFYSDFHTRIDVLMNRYKSALALYKASLGKLNEALKQRQCSLCEVIEFVQPEDATKALEEVFSEYENICKENNSYTKNLSEKQVEAKRKLRLARVYEFDKAYQLQAKEQKAEELNNNYANATAVVNDARLAVKAKEDEIAEKRREMNDQTRAVNLINNYLSWLGDRTFMLKPEVVTNGEVETVYFKVYRGDVLAYNLSEGECSLIAFCYFLATLRDPDLEPAKPIVWIDDPISSLDSNHVYFVYAMIRNMILAEERCEQLFISTHNLDFLRYLKRMKKWKGREECPHQWLMIECVNGASSIHKMPTYLKNYITEFAYLFKKILQCATATSTDENFAGVLYEFGNAARRFLELYLYFKFPNAKEDQNLEHLNRMKSIFGDKVRSFMVDRVLNEGSHLSGQLERGMLVCDITEAQQVAREILKGVKEEDGRQYKELLKGIGAADPLDHA